MFDLSCNIPLTPCFGFFFSLFNTLALTIYDLTLTGTSKANFNCLCNPLITIHLPYGLTLTSPVSEKSPLLPSRGEMGYYKLHTQGPLYSKNGTQQLISSLTFIPQISVHKGAVFKCQVSYIGKDKIVEERVSEKFTILCKNLFLFLFTLFFIISATEALMFCHSAPPEVSEIQLAEIEMDSGNSSRLFFCIFHLK